MRVAVAAADPAGARTDVRRVVRSLLLDEPAFHDLDGDQRQSLAESMVRVLSVAADQVAEEDAAGHEPLAAAQSAGDEFSGVAAERVAGTTRAILNAVSFPRFVSDLLNGVFKAIVDSNMQQLDSYIDLLNNVAASSDGFADANLGPDRARAPRRRRHPRPPVARPDRRPLARRSAHLRGARARRGRPRRAPRIAAGAARQGRPAPRGRHGRLGLGTARALAPSADRAARRAAVLRRQRRHARAAVDGRRRPLRAATRRARRRRTATLRATPAPPRARRRDGPRGRAADRHPTPARPHQPRHHLDLPTRHRQHRDTPSTPAARRWSPSTARCKSEAQRDRRREAATSSPPVLVQMPARNR
jgi:hypothetical protein